MLWRCRFSSVRNPVFPSSPWTVLREQKCSFVETERDGFNPQPLTDVAVHWFFYCLLSFSFPVKQVPAKRNRLVRFCVISPKGRRPARRMFGGFFVLQRLSWNWCLQLNLKATRQTASDQQETKQIFTPTQRLGFGNITPSQLLPHLQEIFTFIL